MRKLASLQKVIDLQPIPDADAIEVATVLGWHVVVKKGEFKIGDPCVYIEIDSIVPDKPEFAFLEKAHFRIKTVKLRGQISQGICFPVSVLHAYIPVGKVPAEGTDLTDLLGIKKYELPVPAQLAGKVRGNFPGFLPKTDEPRIQNAPAVLERHASIPFYVTEKLDGSSCTFVIKNDEFHVCSRNLDLLDDGKNSIWRLAKEMKIEEKMRELQRVYPTEAGLAIQGEIYGEGIQKNPLKIKGQKIAFFNAYDYIKGEYYSFDDFKQCFMHLDLPMVPLITDLYWLPDTVDKMVEFATKRSTVCPEAWAEGFVFRPLKEASDKELGRLSFKAINPQYLLKHE